MNTNQPAPIVLRHLPEHTTSADEPVGPLLVLGTRTASTARSIRVNSRPFVVSEYGVGSEHDFKPLEIRVAQMHPLG